MVWAPSYLVSSVRPETPVDVRHATTSFCDPGRRSAVEPWGFAAVEDEENSWPSISAWAGDREVDLTRTIAS